MVGKYSICLKQLQNTGQMTCIYIYIEQIFDIFGLEQFYLLVRLDMFFCLILYVDFEINEILDTLCGGYLMPWMNWRLAAAPFWVRLMPRPLPLSAATGGLAAALVNSLFSSQELPVLPPPLTCQDLGFSDHSSIHWPSVLLGLLVGLVLAQILEIVLLFRQYLAAVVRQRAWLSTNVQNSRQRLA